MIPYNLCPGQTAGYTRVFPRTDMRGYLCMKHYGWRRKTAAFMAVVMVAINVTGDLSVMAAGEVPAKSRTESAEDAGDRSFGRKATDSDAGKVTDPDAGKTADPGAGKATGGSGGAGPEMQKETTSVEGTLVFYENGTYTVDKNALRLTVYQNGKIYTDARVTVRKPDEEDIWVSESKTPTGSDADLLTASDSNAEFLTASDSDAVRVTEWEFEASGLPVSDRDGNEYVYTVRDMKAGRDYAVVYQDGNDGWRKVDNKEKEEDITTFFYIPYIKISGTYLAAGADGKILSTLPKDAGAFWEETPPSLAVSVPDEYPELLKKEIAAELSLDGDKTTGKWSVKGALAFDPQTCETVTYGVILEHNAPSFTVNYRNAKDYALESGAAYDGAVIENLLDTAFTYGAALELCWREPEDSMRPEPADVLHIYDGTGDDVTDSVKIWAENGEPASTKVTFSGLNKGETYTVRAESVPDYRAESGSIKLQGMPVSADQENPDLAPQEEMVLVRVKDVEGRIFWNDQNNIYGIRPEKNILSGLVSGAPKVRETEDVSAYMTGSDSGEETEIYVSEKADSWEFVITNLDWDDEIAPLEADGYAIHRETARTETVSTGAAGTEMSRTKTARRARIAAIPAEEDTIINLTADANMVTVTVENSYFSEYGHENAGSFAYIVTTGAAGEEPAPFKGTYLTGGHAHTTSDGTLLTASNGEITFDIPSGNHVKVQQKGSGDLRTVYTYDGTERTGSDLQAGVHFTFVNTERIPLVYVNKNWNDNGNEHRDRKVNSAADGNEITAEAFASHMVLSRLETDSQGREEKIPVDPEEIKSWGIEEGKTVFELSTFSSEANWIYLSDNCLPQYDRDGNEIRYIADEKEDEFTNYFKTSGSDRHTLYLTNTHKYEFKAQKAWNDETYGKTARPDTGTIEKGIVLHRKLMNYEPDGGYTEEIEYDFSKSFSENQRRWEGNSCNKWDYEPVLNIEKDPSDPDCDLWTITIGNLPEYDDVEDKGHPYLYYLTENAVPVNNAASDLKADGVVYEPKYTNVGNHSAVTDALYAGGTLTNTMVGKTSMTFTKEWRDKESRPEDRPKTGTFELLRYPSDLKDAGWMTASPVPGFEMISVDTFPDRKTYKIAGAGTEGVTTVLDLDRFDENGREYIYFVKERGIGGAYEQKLLNDTKFDSFDGKDQVIYDQGVIWNRLSGKINQTVTKKWEAKAYQDLKADVNLTLTREKKLTDAEGNLIPGADGNAQWTPDLKFNQTPDQSKQQITGFLAEVMEKTVSVPGLDRYDEWGWEYRYGLSETSVVNQVTGTPETILVADDKFDMGGHHFEVIDQVDPLDPDHHTIINRLVDKTDLKIQKVWKPGLTDADLAEKPSVLIEVTQNDIPVGYVKFEYSGTAANPSVTVTAGSEMAGTYTNTGITRTACRVEGADMVSEAVVGSLGTDAGGKARELDKYDRFGKEYSYKVTEVEMKPLPFTNTYSSKYHYTSEKRITEEEVKEYGENRRVAVITNYTGIDGEYIHVSKEWLDGYDMAHRGNVTAALQIYEGGSWKFVDKTAKDADGKQVYDQTATDAGRYYTVTLNDGNNWENWFTVGGSQIPSGEKKDYYNRYRVIEIEAGVNPEGYSYDKNSVMSDLKMPQDHKNLVDYYGADLNYGISQTDFEPVGMLKSEDHYYKVTVEARADGGARTDYTLKNRRIAMARVTYEKEWLDQYVVKHPSITVELTRTMQDGTVILDPKDAGLLENGAERSGFPEIKEITIWNNNKGSGEFLNLPKYDAKGELYEYSLRETKIGTADITGGSAQVEIETEGPFSQDAGKETVTYNKSETSSYTVGPMQHTEDVKAYSVQNRLAEAITEFTVHKVWKDDRTEEAKKKRPDLYLNLWRSTYRKKLNAAGQPEKDSSGKQVWVEEKELMDGDRYVDREWATVDSVDAAHEYHWSCKFEALPKYDGNGNKYYYSAEEIMRTPGDYVALYFDQAARDGDADIILKDNWKDTDKILNDGKTFQEYCQDLGSMTEEEARQTFTFAPDDGTIVNIPRATVYIEGKKYFTNMVNAMKINDYPEITLELHRGLEKDPDPVYEVVKEDVTGMPVQRVLNPEADGTKIPEFEFGRQDGTTGALPKYDKDGNEYRYVVSEVAVNGEAIYNADGTVKEDKKYFEWVKDSHDFIITNRYIDTMDLAYKADKRWERPAGLGASSGYPHITVQLNRAMTDGPETGDWNLLLHTVTQLEAQEKTITIDPADVAADGSMEVTFTDLPTYAPNGYKYYYWISEEKTNGYSCDNAADDFIRAAKENTGKYADGKLPKNEIKDAEAQITGAQFVNSYPSRDAGDYVSLAGEKKWSGDDQNRYGTRWDRDKLALELYRYTDDKDAAEKVNGAVFEWNPESDSSKSGFWKYEFSGNEAPAGSGITGFFKYAPDGQPYLYFVKEYYDAAGTSAPGQLVPEQLKEGDPGFAYTFSSTPAVGKDGEKKVEVLSLNSVNRLESVSIQAGKTWDDQNNMYDTRPEHDGLKVYVMRKYAAESDDKWARLTRTGENGTAEDVLLPKFDGSGNSWTARLNNLPKYDSEGKEYQYQAEENLSESSTAAGTSLETVYEKEKTAGTLNGGLVTVLITNRRKTAVSNFKFSMEKVWEDQINKDGLRPDGIRLILFRKVGDGGTWSELKNSSVSVISKTVQDKTAGVQGISFDAKNDPGRWKITWHNLPQQTPDGAKQVYYMAVETAYSYDHGTHWTDVSGPADPAKLDGPDPAAYVYTYGVNDYYQAQNGVAGTANENLKPVPEAQPEEYKFKITNKHDPIAVDLSVKKIWDSSDQEDLWSTRPDQITAGLFYAASGTEAPKDGETPVYAENAWLPYPDSGAQMTAVLNSLNGWEDKTTFTGLPYGNGGEPYRYAFFELDQNGVPEPAGSYTAVTKLEKGGRLKNTYGAGQIASGGKTAVVPVTITNTLERTSLEVTKTWDDSDDRYGLRPDGGKVKIRLQRSTDGVNWTDAGVKEAGGASNGEAELTAGVPYTFSGLPAKDRNGAVYSYRAAEIGETGGMNGPYQVEYLNGKKGSQSSQIFTTEITNRLVTAGSAEVRKQWDDGGDRDLMRPEEIQFYLLDLDGTDEASVSAKVAELDAGGASPYRKKVTESGSGTVKWEDLPKYRPDGSECHYYAYEKQDADSLYENPKYRFEGETAWSEERLSSEIVPDSGTSVKTVEVLNRYTPSAMKIQVVKTWENHTYGTIASQPEKTVVVLQRKIAGKSGLADTDWVSVTDQAGADGYVEGLPGGFLAAAELKEDQEAQNSWRTVFDGLPVNDPKKAGAKAAAPIEYRVKEEAVDGYLTAYRIGPAGKVTQNASESMNGSADAYRDQTVTVTNTMETVTWTAAKEFRGLDAGEEKPGKIYAGLQYKYADESTAEYEPVPGAAFVELTARTSGKTEVQDGVRIEKNDWSAVWTDLPKTEFSEDGTAHELLYRAVEFAAGEDGGLKLENGEPVEGSPDGFQVGYLEDTKDRKTTIINSRRMVLAGEKIWEDENDKFMTRPEDLRLTVWRGVMEGQSGGSGAVKIPLEPYAFCTADNGTGTVTGTDSKPLGGVSFAWIRADGSSRWNYVIEGLPKYTETAGGDRYFYVVQEEDGDVPLYYSRTEQPSKSDQADYAYFGGPAVRQNFKNELNMTELSVKKNWKPDSRFADCGKEDVFEFLIQYRKHGGGSWTDYRGGYALASGLEAPQAFVTGDGRVTVKADSRITVRLPEQYEFRVEENPGTFTTPYLHSYTADITGGDRTGAFETSGTMSKDREIIFTNQVKVETGSLTVKKTVSGDDGQKDRQFPFTADFTYPDGQLRTERFSLKHGQSKNFENLPAGTAYEVSESGSGDYAVTVSGEPSGVIAADIVSSAAFDNHKDKTGGLRIEKTVSGDDGDQNERFRFTVKFTYDGKETVDTVFLKHGESKVYGKIRTGTEYRIEEESKDYQMTVVSGSLNGIIGYDRMDQVLVDNHREKLAGLVLKKTVSGAGRNPAGKFKFRILLSYQNGSSRMVYPELGNEEEYHIGSIPMGTRYVIEEDTADGYIMTVTEGELEGVLTEKDQVVYITVDNRKVPDDDGNDGGSGGGGNGSGTGSGHKIPSRTELPKEIQLPAEIIMPEPVPGANINLDTPGDVAPHREIKRLPKTGQTEDGPGYTMETVSRPVPGSGLETAGTGGTAPAPVSQPSAGRSLETAGTNGTAPAPVSQLTAGTTLNMNSIYQPLYEQNHDMAGWISIPGTQLDYPVMLTPNDTEFYLHRNFEKQQNFAGLPFIGESCTADSMNILIHGHNMKNGSAFATLLYYKDASFWRQHPTINFNSLTAVGEYEIIGVFKSQVYPEETENVFKFYQWSGDMNKDQFAHYIQEVKKASLYETGITAAYGDQLITLATCAYHVTDGRFVVVARKKGALAGVAAEVERRMAEKKNTEQDTKLRDR